MEEPNALLRWTIFLFAGGDGAIWGVFFIAAIVASCFYPSRRRPARSRRIVAGIAVGLIVIACASPPVPVWFQCVTAAWLAAVFYRLRKHTPSAGISAEQMVNSKPSGSQTAFFLSPFVWLLTALALEMPFHRWQVPLQPISTILVIGDSVSAGLNDGDDTWPRQLSRTSNAEILDASQPGATLRSARKQNARLAGHAGLVVVEIGGNDMLEGLPVTRFEEDLDRLLAEIVQPDRTVVMFELPLPPFFAAYGAIQRRQAARHQVRLIPKSLFATVLTTRSATVDGIHLSDVGQTHMMHLIQKLLGDRLPAG